MFQNSSFPEDFVFYGLSLMLYDSASDSKGILAIMQFYTYESLKQSMLSSQNSSAQPNTLQTVCSSLFVCSLYKCSPVVCNIFTFQWCWLGGWIIAFSFSIFNTFTRIFLDKVQSMQLVCGGLAGSTAALFTTPFDVVKTRLQTQVCECIELLLWSLM